MGQSGQPPQGPPGGQQDPRSGNPFAFMGGQLSGNAAPPMPDYTGAAEKQAQSGQQSINQQTQANRPDQHTDFGSTSWTKDANGNWVQNTSLSPQMQGLQGQFTQQLGANAGADAFRNAADAAYKQETSRLDPMWAQQQGHLQQQLANQGLDGGSEAAQNAYGNFGRARNDAYQGALNDSIGLGQAAQGQMFSQGMGGLNALHGFMNMPGFNAAGAYQPTQYLPATMAQGQYGMDAARMNQEAQADAFGGLGQAAKSAVGLAPFLIP